MLVFVEPLTSSVCFNVELDLILQVAALGEGVSVEAKLLSSQSRYVRVNNFSHLQLPLYIWYVRVVSLFQMQGFSVVIHKNPNSFLNA